MDPFPLISIPFQMKNKSRLSLPFYIGPEGKQGKRLGKGVMMGMWGPVLVCLPQALPLLAFFTSHLERWWVSWHLEP